MSAASLPTDVWHAALEAARWTTAVDEALGGVGPDPAYRALRATLVALGDSLPPVARAALSGALPSLLRGGLHAPPSRRRDPLARIAGAARHAARRQEIVRAVCAVLERELPPEVWGAVRDALPPELGSLLRVPAHPG